MQQRVLELIERVANEEVVGEWSDEISTVAHHVDVKTHLYPLKEFLKIYIFSIRKGCQMSKLKGSSIFS